MSERRFSIYRDMIREAKKDLKGNDKFIESLCTAHLVEIEGNSTMSDGEVPPDILKTEPIPMDNMFVELKTDEVSLGAYITMRNWMKETYNKDNAKEYMVYSRIILKDAKPFNTMCLLIPDKAPRFFVPAGAVQCFECKDKIATDYVQIGGIKACLRSPRNANTCIPGMLQYLAIQLLAHAVKCLNGKINTIEITPDTISISEVPNRYRQQEQHCIYIRKTEYIGCGTKLGYDRQSPVPHQRRGHWRHLHNGTKIWIEECYIKGQGKGQKRYVIDN